METVIIAIAITLGYFLVGMVISSGFVEGGHPLIASIWPLIIAVYILMIPITFVLALSGVVKKEKAPAEKEEQ